MLGFYDDFSKLEIWNAIKSLRGKKCNEYKTLEDTDTREALAYYVTERRAKERLRIQNYLLLY